MNTFKQQQNEYHKFPLNIQPEHKGKKDELHMIERNFLAFYKQITHNGTSDAKYMSRRLAQSTGLYEFGTVKPQIQQAERIVEGLVKKGYLEMYKLGDDIMIKYTVKTEPKVLEPLPGTSGLF